MKKTPQYFQEKKTFLSKHTPRIRSQQQKPDKNSMRLECNSKTNQNEKSKKR